MSRVNNVNKIKQNSQHFSSIFTIGFIRLGLVIILLLLVRSRLLLPAMLVFFLLFMVESARFWSRYALKRLNPSITLFPQRLFAGEEMKLKLSWHNNKLLPAMIDWKHLESLARLNSIPYGKLDTLLFSEENRLPFGTTLLVLGDGTEISKPPGVRHVNSFSMINH